MRTVQSEETKDSIFEELAPRITIVLSNDRNDSMVLSIRDSPLCFSSCFGCPNLEEEPAAKMMPMVMSYAVSEMSSESFR